jgi:hypothetical protein
LLSLPENSHFAKGFLKMTEEKTQGLLLQSIPYLGQQKILKVLTADHGLISLFAKSGKFPTTPFCIAEWVYRASHKELHSLKDATLLDPLLELRQDFAILSTAGAIAQDLLRTQFPNRKAPFALACAYLKKLPALNPKILLASFRLKLLLHEGLLSPEREPLFTPTEWEQISTLAFARQFSLLEGLQAAPFDKIKLFFEEKLSCH